MRPAAAPGCRKRRPRTPARPSVATAAAQDAAAHAQTPSRLPRRPDRARHRRERRAGRGARRGPGPDRPRLAAPSPVLATDRQRHLVYEIELHNPTRERATLTRAVVRDGGRGTRLAAYAGARLVRLLGPYGQPIVPAPVVEPGQGLTLYLDVEVPRGRGSRPR